MRRTDPCPQPSPGNRGAMASPGETASWRIPWPLSIPCPGGDWSGSMKVKYYTSLDVCTLGGVIEKHFMRVSTLVFFFFFCYAFQITPMVQVASTNTSLTLSLSLSCHRVLRHLSQPPERLIGLGLGVPVENLHIECWAFPFEALIGCLSIKELKSSDFGKMYFPCLFYIDIMPMNLTWTAGNLL